MKRQKIGDAVVESDNIIRPGHGIHGRGTIVKEHPRTTPTKAMCTGCYEDDYNHGLGGATECWLFKTARVVDKVGYSSIYVENGPDTVMRRTNSCWNGVRR
jgi:hypothetical protein